MPDRGSGPQAGSTVHVRRLVHLRIVHCYQALSIARVERFKVHHLDTLLAMKVIERLLKRITEDAQQGEHKMIVVANGC